MREINFIIPGDPIGKERPRFVPQADGTVRTYTADKTAEYETLIAWTYPDRSKGITFSKGPVTIELFIYLSVPASASEKEREKMLNNYILPCKKPDYDNVAKAVCDALIHKRYSDNPRVEVTITGD